MVYLFLVEETGARLSLLISPAPSSGKKYKSLLQNPSRTVQYQGMIVFFLLTVFPIVYLCTVVIIEFYICLITLG